MGQISEAKLEIVKGLIEQAPDTAIRNLLLALSHDQGHDAGLTRVQLIVEAEANDRRARNLVFAPIAPLCSPPGPFSGLTFPPRTLALIWRALKAEQPEGVTTATALAAEWRGGESGAEAFDALCEYAAAGIRAGAGPFGSVVAAADAGGGHDALAGCLDIAPVARRALDQMSDWLGRMTSEKAAKLRLIYKDVAAIAEDAGPRFFEMLAANLTEPWLVLRIISGVMDHPHETYFSSSELASFGERVLTNVDRHLAEISDFKAAAGPKAAHSAAAAVKQASMEIAELELSINLSPDGVWGRRLGRQKKTMAATIEALLKATDDAAGQALPLQTLRIGHRATRHVPRLTLDPDPAHVEKATALLTFMNEVRSSASTGGFASARAKAVEVLETRLDAYIEDLLEEIRSGPEEHRDRARAFLEIAASYCGLARDDKAAQIVRRRAAAA